MTSNPWRLPELLKASGIDLPAPVPDLLIHQVTDDSRTVCQGALFVAVKGEREDGHRFLSQAIHRGARVVLLEEDYPAPDSVVKLQVPSTRPLLGPLVSTFLGSPSEKLKIIGVTGTNGKTTTAWLIHHLLESAGLPCGLIGTVSYRLAGSERPSENTTPGATSLQETLSQMWGSGMKACAMEVSSHALVQHRTDGVIFRCAVFTNLTPEHLDYHGTFQEYLKAKLRLFEGLDLQATAVIHRMDPSWESVRDSTKASVTTFALREDADLSATEIRLSLERTTCRVRTPEGSFPVTLGLIGRHNVENLLAALGAVMSLGIPAKKALEGLPTFPGVPGRLERIDQGQPFPVFVDYAHTEEALRRVLTQLRAVTSRRILVVFGCGGDRDRSKRPRMGEVAAQWADRVIVTSDNPRSEDPAAIAKEIAAGLRGSSTSWEILLDRRQAIQSALESADTDWLVLIAGKGHETVQIIGDERLPFDDRAVAREILHVPV